MVGIGLCILAAIGTFVAARRSLAAGLKALLIVGYFYGLARGRYPDGATHFIFDTSLISLYVAHFTNPLNQELRERSEDALTWARVLMAWPVVCLAYGPALESSQPFVVQLIGLRIAVIMIPCLVIGARIRPGDLDQIAPTVAVLNFAALAFAAVEYVLGVGAVVPENVATEAIYATRDVVAQSEAFHRIPATFISSHMYGGVMALSVPFLVHGLEQKTRNRVLLCGGGIGAAFVGAFVCGARSPVLTLGVASVYALFTMRARFGTLFAFAILGAGVYYVVSHNERLQRFETLGDTDYVQARLSGSMNRGFFDLLADYPVGAGLATAFGSSIPFFMRGIAKPAIGIENEFGHILVEQGIPGLLLWLGFAFWLITRRQSASTFVPIAGTMASAVILMGGFVTSLTGAGVLAAMPATPMLLLLCGIRAAAPPREQRKLALRHVGAPRTGGLRTAFTSRGSTRQPRTS